MERKFKKRLTKLLSEPMTDFDCGQLCASQNDGVPHCCDSRVTFPVLYRPEFEWHRDRSDFWKPMRTKCRTSKRYFEEIDPSSLLAVCPGPKNVPGSTGPLSEGFFLLSRILTG